MRVRWTEPAAADLTAICDYIDEHDGPERARRVAITIYESKRSADLLFKVRGISLPANAKKAADLNSRSALHSL